MWTKKQVLVTRAADVLFRSCRCDTMHRTNVVGAASSAPLPKICGDQRGDRAKLPGTLAIRCTGNVSPHDRARGWSAATGDGKSRMLGRHGKSRPILPTADARFSGERVVDGFLPIDAGEAATLDEQRTHFETWSSSLPSVPEPAPRSRGRKALMKATRPSGPEGSGDPGSGDLAPEGGREA